MTLTHRLIFIDGEATKRHQNMSNPDKNPSISEADSQMPPKSNFLDDVFFKVWFTKEIDGSEELANALYSRVGDIFPDKNRGIHNILETNIVSPEKVEQRQRILLLPNFIDAKSTKQLFAEPMALIIRQQKYTTFDDFFGTLKKGINAFEQVYGTNTAVKRAELRYINRVELSGDPLKWKNLIKSELISLLNFPPKESKISRAMNLIELTREGYNVRFQSGLWNRDYPEPVAKREFILDYACYSTKECEIKQVPELADKFHTEIKSLFNYSILTTLKRRLGEV